MANLVHTSFSILLLRPNEAGHNTRNLVSSVFNTDRELFTTHHVIIIYNGDGRDAISAVSFVNPDTKEPLSYSLDDASRNLLETYHRKYFL